LAKTKATNLPNESKNLKKTQVAKPTTYIEASATGTSATIRIVDRISEWTQSSSITVRNIVDEYLKTGVLDVNVYINSAGGSCFEANEMVNDLKRLPKVNLTIGAIAASAATYFMTEFPSAAYLNSQFMIHRPKLGTYGDVVVLKADLKLLENTTDIYKAAYSRKMNKTEEQIEEYFAQGDYWMTANEAKALGLLDRILDEDENVTAESIKVLEAVAAPVIPKININENHNTMERKLLISKLKLAADATDADIETALSNLQADAAKTASLEAKAKTDNEANAKKLVADAIAVKKITADQQAQYEKFAIADFEGTKTILDAMQVVQKASEHIENGATAQGREKWTLEDYQNNDPQALATMMTTNPEAFKKLEDAYFL
jgi:ATP-dependent protease ClpP protease subunit